MTLATNLLGDGTLDPAAGDRIADASGGNPLFVEEYVSMLVEEGGLRRDGDRWVLPGSALRVSTPPSLAALLAAKLDRLPPDERAVLVYASVIGKVFSTGELEALLPSAHILDLDGTLGRLRDRELIRPAHGAEPGGAPYEFLHLLVRDSAYESLPKATRADLHERFAAWLETSLGPRAEEYQEIVGYHLGQAHRYLRELGSQDPRLDELAAHAAERLGAAGRRAAARGDAPAAQRLLERAADLSPEPAVRADDRLRMLGSLLDSGGAARAPSILRLARDDVTAAGDPGLTARLRLVEANLQILTDPTSTTLEALRATFRDDGEHLARLGDEWSVASARAGEALVAWFTGDAAGMLEAAERALEAALGSGNRREAAVAATYVFLALERGPTPYEGALDRMLALEPALASDRVASAARLLTQADFLATMGRSDEAHRDLDTATSSLADPRSGALAGDGHGGARPHRRVGRSPRGRRGLRARSADVLRATRRRRERLGAGVRPRADPQSPRAARRGRTPRPRRGGRRGGLRPGGAGGVADRGRPRRGPRPSRRGRAAGGRGGGARRTDGLRRSASRGHVGTRRGRRCPR